VNSYGFETECSYKLAELRFIFLLIHKNEDQSHWFRCTVA